LSYFGPPPSTTNPSLVGPVQLLNTGKVDATNGTITIPLYKGTLKGTKKTVWYILTDVDNSDVAAELGLNFSAKLNFASNAARTGNLDANGNIVFDKGTVNFAANRAIVPGPTGAEFPPTSATPGAVGDANYSPYVSITNAGGVIYNAPMVAFDVDATQINFPNGNVDYSKVHDQVVAIDPINMTVTINLINGFSFGRPVWYLSMDASIPLAAAIEHNTYAPLMGNLLLGHDDSFGSPIERIFLATNGPESGQCNKPLVKVCRRTLPMGIDQTTFLVVSQPSLSITAQHGTPSCTSGPVMQSTRASVDSFVKNFKSSPSCRMV
jgi:hypothetical protein